MDLHLTFQDPIIITTVEAFCFQKHYLVRVRSEDGAEGIVTGNSRLASLWPILQQIVAPYFIGKDVRDLDKLVKGVYTYRSAYKLAGIALWSPVAYVELAILRYAGQNRGKTCV